MMLQYQSTLAPALLTSEDQAAFSEKLQHNMQLGMYSNRMRVAPRRIKDLAKEEVALLQEFLVNRETNLARERGQHLAREGLGLQSLINLSSTLRLSCWEIALKQSNHIEFVTAIEAYTSALFDGFLTTYEEELRREQQRTHEAFLRSLDNH